ncbi:XF1762 family protein [Marinicaulis aureus]|uniref:XF1762 family protein n=1 Tax=Hyphococcus aureus TaxID=2666033 RepID=A0ABW1L0L0_9PROT
MAKSLSIAPTTIKQANEFIKEYHRHHRPTIRSCGRWALAALDYDQNTVGVAIAGNPVSANFMDGYTIELTRLCVKESAPKGTCSFLISTCCKIWRTMGGTRVITYTLDTESGASLKGAGWKLADSVKPHKRWQNKSRADGIMRSPLEIYKLTKLRWEKHLKDEYHEPNMRV